MSDYTLALGTLVVGALAYVLLRGRPTQPVMSVDTRPPDFQQDIVHAEAPKAEAPPPGPEPDPIDEIVHVRHEEAIVDELRQQLMDEDTSKVTLASSQVFGG